MMMITRSVVALTIFSLLEVSTGLSFEDLLNFPLCVNIEPPTGFFAPSLPAGLENLLCPVFELYGGWHCRAQACPDSFGDCSMSDDFMVFGDMYVGGGGGGSGSSGSKDDGEACISDKGFFCMLEPFHEFICPSPTGNNDIECSCDQNFRNDPLGGPNECREDNLDEVGQKTTLVRYCEALTGQTWETDPKKGNSPCLQGCTRYIAAEGYGCCPLTCTFCRAADIECPDRECYDNAKEDNYGTYTCGER